MKLSEALAKVVRTKANDGGCEIEALMTALRLDRVPDWDTVERRLHGYWISRWFCYDAWVGCKALYLDDLLVGYTTQEARKSPVEVKFMNAQAADAVRTWLLSCTDGTTDYPPLATQFALNIDIGPAFGVRYSAEILDREGYYRGERADVVSPGNPRNYIDQTLIIQSASGRQTISVADFRSPFHVEGQWPLQPLPAEPA